MSSIVLFRFIRGHVRLHCAQKPQWTPHISRPRPRPRLLQPLVINLHRLVGVDKDVRVTIARLGLSYGNFLMPAMHAADGIGLHGERQILMDARIRPPHASGIRIGRCERLNALGLTHHQVAVFARQRHHSRRPALAAVRTQCPTSQVVRARHDAGLHALGDPRAIHEVSNCG